MVTAVADGLSSTYYLFKQLQWFILGLIGFVVFAAFPYRKLQRLTKWIVILSVISLIYVIFFGETVNQAQRAINLFGLFNLQPRSEEHTSELQSRGHLVCCLLLE